MPLDLAWILDSPLPPGTKGLPTVSPQFTLRDVAGQGWSLLDDVPLPAATLRASTLSANLTAMQHYLGERGAELAPHGKTTMCPQLFERQLDAGAWGITVATVAQARLCQVIGVSCILIANEVVGAAELSSLVTMRKEEPGRELLLLVDSLEGARRLDEAFAAAGDVGRAQVLLELGFPSGRCGVRTIAAAIDLAREIRQLNHIDLRGIEGYEGLIVGRAPDVDAAAVSTYLAGLREVVRTCLAERLFAGTAAPIVSAGGSVYYDLVASLADDPFMRKVQLIVRSGCYLTQDQGFYRRALDHVAVRAIGGEAPRLAPALQVWARVLSVPEHDRAILSAGKRDVSFDIDLPIPELLHRPGVTATPQPLAHWRVTHLSDQHAFAIRQTEAAPDLQVGDMVALGISHPCTTFDKWPVLLEIDDDHRVIGAVRTFF